ncbi:MAG: helix-turn-helix transcriptional regulator [Chloroflexota bacterium]
MKNGFKKWGEALKAYRQAAGLSQIALAGRIGVDNSLIARWEKGQRTVPKTRETHLALLKVFAENHVLADCNEAQAFLKLADMRALTETEYKRHLASRVKWPFSPTQADEEDDKARPSYDDFLQEIRLSRSYTELTKIESAKPVHPLAARFDFVGIQWTNFFAFSLAVIQIDTLRKPEIVAKVEAFKELNNTLYTKRRLLEISRLLGWLTYTNGGILCFVFANGMATTQQDIEGTLARLDFLNNLRQEGETYADPIGTGKVLTTASTFVWGYDLQGDRVFETVGKKPVQLNYHIAKINQKSAAVVDLLKRARQKTVAG